MRRDPLHPLATPRPAPAYWFAAACALHLCAIVFAWWHVSGRSFSSGAPGSDLVAIGRLVGLLAGSALLVQVALVSRLPWIEPYVGCDRLFRLHRYIGSAVPALIVAHPMLITFGSARRHHISIGRQFAEITTGWSYTPFAVAGLAIILVVVASSLPPIRRRLSYDAWHAGHLAMYVAIGLVLLHQANGKEMIELPWWGRYWVALHVAVIGSFVVFRIGRPLFTFARHRFRIDRVVSESDDVVSIYLTGRRLDRFTFRAGQYANVIFLTRTHWPPHPFSFSAAANGRFVRMSVKAVGDYTARIRHLTPGTFVLLEGPLGAFTADDAADDKYLMVAGGIGITPIRALVESLAPAGLDIVLLYAARTADDLVFASELRALTPRCHFILSKGEPGRGYERGRVDRTILERLVPDVQQREAFICGPPPMMEGVIGALRGLGVVRSRIHYERFT